MQPSASSLALEDFRKDAVICRALEQTDKLKRVAERILTTRATGETEAHILRSDVCPVVVRRNRTYLAAIARVATLLLSTCRLRTAHKNIYHHILTYTVRELDPPAIT